MTAEEQKPAPAPKGIACPKCNSTPCLVRQTVRKERCVVRYRQCANCGMRVRTRESRQVDESRQ